MTSKTTPEARRQAAADLWRRTLSQIPAVFGRLAYLASLRDPNSGEYRHHGLATVFGPSEADEAMRESHALCFAEWLSYPLAQQKADLDLYVSTLEPERKTLIGAWTKFEPYRDLVPETARAVERELFFADLEALLSLMRNECGVSLPDRDA